MSQLEAAWRAAVEEQIRRINAAEGSIGALTEAEWAEVMAPSPDHVTIQCAAFAAVQTAVRKRRRHLRLVK